METEDLQDKIKELLAKLNWSFHKLAEVIYVEKFDDDEVIDEIKAIKKFEEKLKKQLNRETTKPALLEEYLLIVSRHNDFTKLGIVLPHYIKSGLLSDNMESGMEAISKKIGDLIVE